MATMPDPKGELVLTVTSNYGGDEEVARLPVDLGITMATQAVGRVSLEMDSTRLGHSVLVELEKFVAEMRAEYDAEHEPGDV
jgi:hypothetical protein